MNIIEQFQTKIKGVLSCYDRVLIQGILPGLCYAQGMTSYLYSKNIRIFDYQKIFAEPYREKIRANAERLASEHGIKVEFLSKSTIRKEDIIHSKLKLRGDHPGLVAILSSMESCPSFYHWHDKAKGKTYLKYKQGKCLHYYFYFIDEDLGLCFVRVPTWSPFGLQIYFNGHNYLASLLKKKGIGYQLRDNAFIDIDDFAQAQKLSDSFDVELLHRKFDEFSRKYCPVVEDFTVDYHWSVAQVEYATDIVFNTREDLQLIYEDLFKTAIHTVTPDNIATFLEKKKGVHPNYKGEVGSNYNVRLQGRRIKHQMGKASIKMYDKFGQILRIETTSVDISFFKHYREVEHRDGSRCSKVANFKKNIYSLGSLREVMYAANKRYLDFLSHIQTKETGRLNLEKISAAKEENNRRYSGFNLFDAEDLNLLKTLIRGEYLIQGFQNKMLRQHLSNKTSGQISRLLKRLHVYGFISKVGRTYKYYLTKFGKDVITLALKLREMVIIPELNVLKAD